MESVKPNGIIEIVSQHTVNETVEKLRQLLEKKGITLFVMIDHSGEAAKVGLSMPPTRLLIFGSPQGGTPVMVTSPSSAIDLPLKILIAENSAGEVVLSYNATDYLAQRHSIPADLAQNLGVISSLAEYAVR